MDKILAKRKEEIARFEAAVAAARAENRQTVTLPVEVADEVMKFVVKQLDWLSKIGRKPSANPTRAAKYMRKARSHKQKN